MIVLISFTYAVFFMLAFVADLLPLIKFTRQISTLTKMSVKTIGSVSLTDSEKQRILLGNSSQIFKQSLKIGAIVVLILVIGYLIMLVANFFQLVKRAVFFNFVESIGGITVSVLAFCSYFLIKRVYVRARL